LSNPKDNASNVSSSSHLRADLPDNMMSSLLELKRGARLQRSLQSSAKTKALENLAKDLLSAQAEILAANAEDLARFAKSSTATATPAFRDRLTLNPDRIQAMATSLRAVASLPDPNNEVTEERVLENGLKIRRVRAPLGCLFMIFESRPNVILEAFSLAFKSGNVILLRGGSDSTKTAEVLYRVMADCLQLSGLTHTSFVGLQDYDRSLVEKLLTRKDLIDVVVPRGGDRLIEFVQAKAHMPIIKNDRGLCHTFVDQSANLEMAARIVANAKIQRPGVCNSLETLLVHTSIAAEFLPKLFSATAAARLRWKVDPASLQILGTKENVEAANQSDWDTEHLDLILNCRVVQSLDEALAHIEIHGSKHSEAIITSDEVHARRFQSEVDAAAVYWNASTRFTDGFSLGLGGELGISTQKLHVRGPVGLKELTTPRWVIDGEGQIRES
jgi:glutamate-5-semialdehyde dehydrogenase